MKHGILSSFFLVSLISSSAFGNDMHAFCSKTLSHKMAGHTDEMPGYSGHFGASLRKTVEDANADLLANPTPEKLASYQALTGYNLDEVALLFSSPSMSGEHTQKFLEFLSAINLRVAAPILVPEITRVDPIEVSQTNPRAAYYESQIQEKEPAEMARELQIPVAQVVRELDDLNLIEKTKSPPSTRRDFYLTNWRIMSPEQMASVTGLSKAEIAIDWKHLGLSYYTLFHEQLSPENLNKVRVIFGRSISAESNLEDVFHLFQEKELKLNTLPVNDNSQGFFGISPSVYERFTRIYSGRNNLWDSVVILPGQNLYMREFIGQLYHLEYTQKEILEKIRSYASSKELIVITDIDFQLNRIFPVGILKLASKPRSSRSVPQLALAAPVQTSEDKIARRAADFILKENSFDPNNPNLVYFAKGYPTELGFYEAVLPKILKASFDGRSKNKLVKQIQRHRLKLLAVDSLLNFLEKNHRIEPDTLTQKGVFESELEMREFYEAGISQSTKLTADEKKTSDGRIGSFTLSA